MKRLCLCVALLLMLVAPTQALGPGTVYSFVDGIPSWFLTSDWQQNGGFPVQGWVFHSGGAAILHYSLRLETGAVISTGVVIGGRPDVQALFASTGDPVPDNIGWVAGVFTANVPPGYHTFTMCTLDAEHVTVWQCSAPGPTYYFPGLPQ